MNKKCPNCRHEFQTNNPNRIYCSLNCRRTAQNTLRKRQRAEEKARQEGTKRWLNPDPWHGTDEEDILKNSLLDPVPQ